MNFDQFKPKADPADVRDKSISLRVTYKEFIAIKREAMKRNMSVTQWAREVLKGVCEPE